MRSDSREEDNRSFTATTIKGSRESINTERSVGNGRPESLDLVVGNTEETQQLLITARTAMPGVMPVHSTASMGQAGEVTNSRRSAGHAPQYNRPVLSPAATGDRSNTSEIRTRDYSGELLHGSVGDNSTRNGSKRALPSYLNIACIVSGYSSINRYDSAVREGFRSRDSSPAPPRLGFTRSRDSSPLRDRLKSPENRSTPAETAVRISELKAQLARCAQELSGQITERSRQNSIRRRDKKPPSGRSISVDRGYLTKASEINTGASQGYTEDKDRYSAVTSPRENGSRLPGYYSSPRHHDVRDHSISSSSRSTASARQGYFSGGNMTSHQIPVRLLDAQQNFNGHLGSPLALHSRSIDNIEEDTRSFIQERIERLYGPGALAVGFIKRTPSHTNNMGNAVKRTPNARSKGRIIPIQLECGPDEVDNSKPSNETPVQGLPSVFRHLRPEFRHQLPVKSPVSGSNKLFMKRSDSSELIESNGHHLPCAIPSPAKTDTSLYSRPNANIVPPPLQAPRLVERVSNKSTPANSTVTTNGICSATAIQNEQLLDKLATKANNKCDISVANGSSSIVTKLNSNTNKVCPVVSETEAAVKESRSHNGCSGSDLGNKVAPQAVTKQSAVFSVSAATKTEASGAGASVVKPTEEKDGHYFLKVVAETVSSLTAQVEHLEAELERHGAGMTEEVNGKLFAGTGKTRLLMSQKIKQFTGLCHKNIAGQQGTGEFPTTCADLAGFWDMVSLQVEDVRESMRILRTIRDNGWKEVATSDSVDSRSKPATGSTTRQRRVKVAPTAASKAKDEARKKAIEERRRAMREAMKAGKAATEASAGQEDEVQIFVPQT